VGGKDQIVDTAATKRIYERVATAKSQKTWRPWDEAFHTLCWDSVTPELVADLAKWALRAGAKECKDPGSEIGCYKQQRERRHFFVAIRFSDAMLVVAVSTSPLDSQR